MKQHTRIIVLLLVLCLLATSLSGCGKEAPADTAAPAAAATEAPVQVEATEAKTDSPFAAAVATLQQYGAQCEGYALNYDCDGIGTIDGIDVEFSIVISRDQPKDSDNLSVYHSASVTAGKRFEYNTVSNYYTDGVYYSEDRKENIIHLCTEPSITPAAVPGIVFLNALATCEKTSVDETELIATFTLTGYDLKDIVADLLPTVYSEIDPAADWSDVQADFMVDIDVAEFSGITWIRNSEINSPSLGKLLLQSAKPGCSAECSEFTISRPNIDYRATFFDTVLRPDEAVPGKPFPFVGLNRTLKQALGIAEEDLEIQAEKEAAENFTPVVIVDHESTLPDYFPDIPDQPAQTPATEPPVTEPPVSEPTAAPEIPELDENTISLTVNNKTVLFSIPSEIKHYDKLKQDSPERAVMVHDIFTNISGRTIVEIMRGTPEEYISFYLRKDMSETETVSIDGRDVLLWKQKSSSAPENGTAIHNDYYYFAVALDNNTLLGFRVDATYKSNAKCEIDDSIVQILLSHCTFL